MNTPSQQEREEAQGYAWYVLGVLLVVYVFNFVDRQILSIVLPDIKAEMQVSDTLLGLLSGPAFAMFYVLAGIPIARWADVGSRRTIISLGLFVWSGMTMLCGVAQNFVHLTLARIGVGIGEAAGTPPSHSIISDYFGPERRATALSIYATGIYLGVMFGFLLGGVVKEAFDWRTAFLVAGLPGIPLALLVRATVKEPPRGLSERVVVDVETPTPREVLRVLTRTRSFVWIICAACCLSLSGYSILSWVPSFLVRVHGMTGAEIGTSMGIIAGVGGGVGATLGGWLSDRLAVRDRRWYVWLPAITAVASVPFAIPFYLADDPTTALLFFAPFYLLGNMYVGPLWSTAQSLVKVRMRALTSAIQLTILNIAGLGAGPLLVGVLNDALDPRFGEESIRYSLLGAAIVGGLGSIFFLLAARTIRHDLERAAV